MWKFSTIPFAAITSALTHGTKFIVNDAGEVEVRNPERMPAETRNLLRENWREAVAEILARENHINSGTPHHCTICDAEIGRWIDGNLRRPGYLAGWGERGWANIGQAIPEVRCDECGATWRPEYRPGRDPRL